MINDACELCGRVDPHLVEGACSVCRRNEWLTHERLLAVLSQHIGKLNGLTIAQLADRMAAPRQIGGAHHAHVERSIRELIVQLRLQGHHIVALPESGYFLAASPEELDAGCNFLYDRAMTSLTQVAAMKRVSLPDLRGQLNLPT